MTGNQRPTRPVPPMIALTPGPHTTTTTGGVWWRATPDSPTRFLPADPDRPGRTWWRASLLADVEAAAAAATVATQDPRGGPAPARPWAPSVPFPHLDTGDIPGGVARRT